MKQVKFWTVALTVLMGAMVTSCMEGETNTIDRGSVPMRVKSGMFGTTFVSGSLDVVPTNPLLVGELPSDTKIALVSYQYDKALQPITENTTKLNVDLLSEPQSLDAPLNISLAKDDAWDVQSTHSISSLSVAAGYGYVEPYILPVMAGKIYPTAPAEFFLIAPIQYKIKSVQKEEELTAELKKHTFTMVLSLDDIKSGDTSMVVYLRHVINEESTTDEKIDRTYGLAEYKAFDLNRAIVEFKTKSGVNPKKVIVKAMENTSSDELKTANEKSYERELKIEE